MITMGGMKEEVSRWLRGDWNLNDEDDNNMASDAINDAIESIWTSMMQVQISRMMGANGPVSFTLNAGTERVTLVSIVDPVAILVAAAVAGGALGARNYQLGYTYVTESGSETNISPLTVLAVGANQVAQINPPADVPGALGWNLYSGSTALLMGLQNQDPLPFGVAYTEPIEGFVDYPDAQQSPPISNATGDNISYIRHLEITTTDGLKRSFSQDDIDSSTMRGLAGTIASASEYQQYAWDLINGRTIEIRPTTAISLNPRYFFVQKPRRIRYDQALVPYTEITGVREFIRKHALSNIKLAVEEYVASEEWARMTEMTRQEVKSALNQEDWSKGNTVRRYL